MGNCMKLLGRAETPHHSSDPSKASSKRAVSSGPSSQTTSCSNPSTLTAPSYTSTLTVPSYTERSNTEYLPTQAEEAILASSSLKDFSFNELRMATRNFRPESLIGEGGFGNVYKGWIDEQTFTAAKPGIGMIVAVKRLKPDSFQGHKEWLAEVNYLGQLHHPNLVKLLGYCSDGENRLLVYEYLLKGSLENHLFRRSTQPLTWSLRIKVAVGAARGLTFLHESEFQIIYRDVKSSNILLDSEYNVKLSDFGLAKEGPTGGKTHISTQIMGTQGYAAPEYIATGRLSVKADVYSYGVVLLELLSGRRAVDNSRRGIEQNLVEWTRPLLADKRKLNLIMDSRLEGRYPKKDAHAVATLALQCISNQAKSRPKMSEVLATLETMQA